MSFRSKYFLKLTIEENGTISSGGMNKEPVNYVHMTVYVRTISGKTISTLRQETKYYDNHG